MQTFYFLYKTTNLINNKVYIGKHKTKNLNDGYIGSGKLLKQALNKYGHDNFKFEIIEFFVSEELLNAAEKEVVTEEFCHREDTYNLCVGGSGGFSYINREGGGLKSRNFSNESRTKMASSQRKYYTGLSEEQKEFRTKQRLKTIKGVKGRKSNFQGKNHSEEARQKMSISHKSASKGEKNSQYGTMWITNGTENKKINKTVDQIPKGWYKGRKINK